ncbi:hypothetical protein AB990_05600 [Alkalihalobacillus pseudalcaliphilus]|nr:hypothetical protein AB990_05600 [Alkalihalobacillus pseudalcaliphilus]
MDYRPFLKDIQVPSYIYVGRFDSQCPAKHGIEIADLIPTAHLIIFEKSNHFPFNEEEKLKV